MFILAVFGFFISMGTAIYMIPRISEYCRITGQLMTTDHHKKNKPAIPEAGGIAPLISFIAAVLIVVFIWSLLSDLGVEGFQMNLADQPFFLGGVLSVMAAGLIGILDDLFKIRWRHKIYLGFLPALPLMILRAGTPDMEVPFIGVIELGILFSILFIPIAVNFAFNSFNMLAGYNGLETGSGIISYITILIVAIIVGNTAIAIFIMAMLGGLVVLLYYNWYPAKILTGDTGTLMMGTGLIVAILLGNTERLAVGIFLLYFINFILFFVYLSKGFKQKLADIDDDEYLKPPCPWTVYWILPYFFKLREQQNVVLLLGLQTFICILTIFAFFAI